MAVGQAIARETKHLNYSLNYSMSGRGRYHPFFPLPTTRAMSESTDRGRSVTQTDHIQRPSQLCNQGFIQHCIMGLQLACLCYLLACVIFRSVDQLWLKICEDVVYNWHSGCGPLEASEPLLYVGRLTSLTLWTTAGLQTFGARYFWTQQAWF